MHRASIQGRPEEPSRVFRHSEDGLELRPTVRDRPDHKREAAWASRCCQILQPTCSQAPHQHLSHLQRTALARHSPTAVSRPRTHDQIQGEARTKVTSSSKEQRRVEKEREETRRDTVEHQPSAWPLQPRGRPGWNSWLLASPGPPLMLWTFRMDQRVDGIPFKHI